MKIIVPMAGKGKRFCEFLSPKPIMEIDGKPMIEHAIDNFKRQADFIFLCNKNHLENTKLRLILERIAPNAKIIGVDEEFLQGPAMTCTKAFPFVEDDEEVIVNYCDFIQNLSYDDFMNSINQNMPDGAIVSFKGFHPSSLGSTYYAYLKVNSSNLVTDIREKQSFSSDKTNDYASTGTYYFKTGKLFKKYIGKLLADEKNAVNGEFYMSLPFLLMVHDGLKVLNYEVDKFICLGTPRDYNMYKFWSEFFLSHVPSFVTFDNINFKVTNIFPLAGGERDFGEFGIAIPNFLIPIMNKTLIDYSFHSNPRGTRNIFVGLESEKKYFLDRPLFKQKNSEIVLLPEKMNGNATTILALKERIKQDEPVCVCGSTYMLNYNEQRVANLLEQKDIDIVMFSFSNHECVLRDPNSFAYARIKNHVEIEEIVEKKTISENPYKDPALTGTAIIKHASDLFYSIETEMEKRPGKKLYYLSCLNNILNKKKAVVFEVDKFVPIRTPVNYREFIYWQEYFDSLGCHPYSKTLQ